MKLEGELRLGWVEALDLAAILTCSKAAVCEALFHYGCDASHCREKDEAAVFWHVSAASVTSMCRSGWSFTKPYAAT